MVEAEAVFEKVEPLAERDRRGPIDIALDQLDGRPGTYRVVNDFGLSYKSWGDRCRRRAWRFTTRNNVTELYVIVPEDG